MTRVLTLLLAVLLLGACSGGSKGTGLTARDPKGADACAALVKAFQDSDDAGQEIADSAKAGSFAKQARTATIRTAILDLSGTTVANPAKLVLACRGAGVVMPDVPLS